MGFFDKPKVETVFLGDANDEAIKFFEEVVAEHGAFCAADEVQLNGHDSTMATHTVGLAEKGWPELVMVGIEPRVAGQVLNSVMKRGQMKAGDIIEGVATIPMRCETISEDAIEAFMGQAIAYRIAHGGREIEALQLVFSDSEKRWPEDEGFNKTETRTQVLLKDYRKPSFKR